ncbi:MAG: ATP-binding protein [Chitinophagales bacterium]
MRRLTDYFLSGFANESPFEKRKASYLLYIIYTAFIYGFLVLVGQLYYHMGQVYFYGNIVALTGVIVSLFLFKGRRIQAAGHVMIISALSMVIIHNLVRDLYKFDPIIRYHIYINMVTLFGVYLLILSFFRSKKVLYYYGVAFELILLGHTLIIYDHLKHIPQMGLFVWQHFTTAATGIFTEAVLCTWLISYIDTLFLQNEEDAERIQLQNEKLEDLVAQRTKALKSSNDNLQEFAYIVSHDLKEPLRTISGFISLIEKDLNKRNLNDEQTKEYLQFVHRGTIQMEELISDILAYSKLNVVERKFEVVDLNDVVADVCNVLSKSINESGAVIKTKDLFAVKGEARLLVQLFQNLLSNAIKYRSEERPLQIEIGCVPQGKMVQYYVKDNGIGIPEKYFDTIFQAFKRLHSKTKYEGTGIGLAICKKIVEVHGGRIWVESDEGLCTAFIFTLPAA